ncbi:putative membrane protein [Escovopsis weberi]|uniref:Putative membrane protein n=1 Tax=Escovopsis weberi TaxID=150374 RepID=A0A0M9VVY9_ESCWE|nr:putative membrane protein [Escovopsis weberi]
MLRGRLIASAAATVISLACGTNYVYSAWAPQFADRLKLSATESNLIGLFGNLGMYTLGVPVGMLVDQRGPRLAVLAGAILLAVGYFPLHKAFDRASGSLPVLCFFSYLTGLGGCMAFAGAVKTSALNWPLHRGTATALPLAAYGLSAFFFSMFGALLFPGDPSAFLMLLSWGTFILTFSGYFFLNVYSQASYQPVPGREADPRSFVVEDPSRDSEPGTSSSSPMTRDSRSKQSHVPLAPELAPPDPPGSRVTDTGSPARHVARDGESSALVNETSPLLSNAPVAEESGRSSNLFIIMAILAGVGLMTIKLALAYLVTLSNIGNNANALWRHYDSSVDDDFLLSHRIGSDLLTKQLRASRIWCLAAACSVFLVAQLCAICISNPQLLGFTSSLSGLAYGMLFGVFPSIVAETFGIRGLSQNWGFMTMSPVLSSNFFNLLYGMIYDRHSIIHPNGQRVCDEGLDCYREAYYISFAACSIGLSVTLWVIHHQWQVLQREKAKGDQED